MDSAPKRDKEIEDLVLEMARSNSGTGETRRSGTLFACCVLAGGQVIEQLERQIAAVGTRREENVRGGEKTLDMVPRSSGKHLDGGTAMGRHGRVGQACFPRRGGAHKDENGIGHAAYDPADRSEHRSPEDSARRAGSGLAGAA